MTGKWRINFNMILCASTFRFKYVTKFHKYARQRSYKSKKVNQYILIIKFEKRLV